MNKCGNSEYSEHLRRLRSTERDCPLCEGIVLENEKEECYECIQCGYIDCSNANEEMPLAKVV